MKGLDKRRRNTPPHGRSHATSNVRIAQAVDAVCDELGIDDRKGRDLIARRVAEAYRRGPRQPLNLVHAGLDAH